MASRFVTDPTARADLVALYAFNHELARVGEVAHEPLVREIRLTWWVEALGEVFADRPPRGHPVLDALAGAIRRRGHFRRVLESMIEARLAEINAPIFADETAVHRHLDATAGALTSLAIDTLDRKTAHVGVAQPVGRAWGLAGLARLRRTGVDHLPSAWSDDDIRARILAAVAEARLAALGLSAQAFPAIAYAALAASYASGRTPSALEKRFRLLGAVLTGRL